MRPPPHEPPRLSYAVPTPHRRLPIHTDMLPPVPMCTHMPRPSPGPQPQFRCVRTHVTRTDAFWTFSARPAPLYAPFHDDNIRQNRELAHGITERIPLRCTTASICVQFFCTPCLPWPATLFDMTRQLPWPIFEMKTKRTILYTDDSHSDSSRIRMRSNAGSSSGSDTSQQADDSIADAIFSAHSDGFVVILRKTENHGVE